MGLSGSQRKELQDALISAFPDKASLEQMLSHKLDKNLDANAGGANLEQIVYNLIKRAEAENWFEDLIDAARRENPGNPKLKHTAKKILGFNSLLTSPKSELPQKTEVTTHNRDNQHPILSEIPVIGNKASKVGADYTKLRNLLENKEFGKADLETLKIILWITNRQEGEYLNREDIEKVPKDDLHTINQLWLVGSDRKFGFSVQKQIWIDLGGKPGEDDKETFERFLEKVEWTETNKVIPDQRAIHGHLPLGLYTACGGFDWQKWWASIDKYDPFSARIWRKFLANTMVLDHSKRRKLCRDLRKLDLRKLCCDLVVVVFIFFFVAAGLELVAVLLAAAGWTAAVFWIQLLFFCGFIVLTEVSVGAGYGSTLTRTRNWILDYFVSVIETIKKERRRQRARSVYLSLLSQTTFRM